MVCIFLFTPASFFPELEISDRIQQKMAFVCMIIQVKAIDTTSDVTLGDIRNGRLKIAPTGIFNIDPYTGEEQRIFLYKRKYNLERFKIPSYHICKCEVIEKFMNNAGQIPEYRQANSMSVWVIDTSDGIKDKGISLSKGKSGELF